MSRIMKKALILGIIGFWIGILIGLTVWYLSSQGEPGELTLSVHSVLELLAGGLYGAISMGSSAVYDVDCWSILRVTFTHFIISFSGFWVLAAIQGWLLINNPFFWLGVMLFIWAYITIWFVNFLIYSQKVKEINNALEDIKDLRNTDENG